ncbi:hypothetical protein GCM10009077_25780 [Roseibium denhamense]|uniref:Uncharacterized protein n=1 Tax=Roseibium denhamense TaxID=76305 RepID=A0ABY1PKM0_9HYPH|nr:hypothetical protein SAMN06265374_4031 [Roseibium denhamense]
MACSDTGKSVPSSQSKKACNGDCKNCGPTSVFLAEIDHLPEELGTLASSETQAGAAASG